MERVAPHLHVSNCARASSREVPMMEREPPTDPSVTQTTKAEMEEGRGATTPRQRRWRGPLPMAEPSGDYPYHGGTK